MAFQNFIPSVWDESILRELERKCVFIEDCNRKYEGKVKKMGESVTILGVGRPTIHTLASSTATIEDAEIIEDTSVIMPINQKKYYHYQVPDIDKAQAVEGLMQSFQQETAEAMANVIDRYVSSKVADATKVYSADTKNRSSRSGRYDRGSRGSRPCTAEAVRERCRLVHSCYYHRFPEVLHPVPPGIRRQRHRQQRAP